MIVFARLLLLLLPIKSPWIYVGLLGTISSFFVYIEYIYMREVWTGVMTRETYARETYFFMRPKVYQKF